MCTPRRCDRSQVCILLPAGAGERLQGGPHWPRNLIHQRGWGWQEDKCRQMAGWADAQDVLNSSSVQAGALRVTGALPRHDFSLWARSKESDWRKVPGGLRVNAVSPRTRAGERDPERSDTAGFHAAARPIGESVMREDAEPHGIRRL